MLRLVLYLSFFLSGPAFAGFSGPVEVIDGDTIRIGETRVRLHAIDAPEHDQMCGSADSPAWACGAWVTSQTAAQFVGRIAHCVPRDTDRYGRVVATCHVDGHDMAARLVRDGLAFAYRRYGMDYDHAERLAAAQGRGLHATGVTSPAVFRAAQQNRSAVQVRQGTGAKSVKVPSTSPTRRSWLPKSLDPACNIKGNISRHGGQRIYHVPGQEYYDQTRISVTKGERWFCTESEAQAAGWRKARK